MLLLLSHWVRIQESVWTFFSDLRGFLEILFQTSDKANPLEGKNLPTKIATSIVTKLLDNYHERLNDETDAVQFWVSFFQFFQKFCIFDPS